MLFSCLASLISIVGAAEANVAGRQRPRLSQLRNEQHLLQNNQPTVDLVVARLHENISWLVEVERELPTVNVIVYDKSNASDACKQYGLKRATCISRPNVGLESEAYLHHIVTRYDSLADKTVFSQGGEPTPGFYGHRQGGGHLMPLDDFLFDFIRPTAPSRYVPTISRLDMGPTEASYIGFRSALLDPFNGGPESLSGSTSPKPTSICSAPEAWDQAFKNDWDVEFLLKKSLAQKVPWGAGLHAFWNMYLHEELGMAAPDPTRFASGAIFSAKRKRITRHHKRFYQKLHESLAHDLDSASAYLLEMAWGYILDFGEELAEPCQPAVRAHRRLIGYAAKAPSPPPIPPSLPPSAPSPPLAPSPAHPGAAYKTTVIFETTVGAEFNSTAYTIGLASMLGVASNEITLTVAASVARRKLQAAFTVRAKIFVADTAAAAASVSTLTSLTPADLTSALGATVFSALAPVVEVMIFGPPAPPPPPPTPAGWGITSTGLRALPGLVPLASMASGGNGVNGLPVAATRARPPEIVGSPTANCASSAVGCVVLPSPRTLVEGATALTASNTIPVYSTDASRTFSNLTLNPIYTRSSASDDTYRETAVAGDFDGDGYQDYVVSDIGSMATSAGPSMWLNNGRGFFALSSSPWWSDAAGITGASQVGTARSMAVGDLDGDGDLDIVLNSGDFMLNNGQASFTVDRFHAAAITVDAKVGNIVLVDVDGDKDLDIVTFIPVGLAGDLTLSLFLNSGSGTFTDATSANLPSIVGLSVEAGDLNGDGKIDLFVTGDLASPVLLNDGSGIFTAQACVASGQQCVTATSVQAKLGDMDGDGDLDIVIASRISGAMYRNTGAGFFEATSAISPEIGTVGVCRKYPRPTK